MLTVDDRRADERYDMTRPGKIYHPKSRKFLPCATCNLSRSGAMLEVACRLPVKAGDQLMLGLSMSPNHALLPSSEMFEVEVVRALPTTDNRLGIAVRFMEPSAPRLALAA